MQVKKKKNQNACAIKIILLRRHFEFELVHVSVFPVGRNVEFRTLSHTRRIVSNSVICTVLFCKYAAHARDLWFDIKWLMYTSLAQQSQARGEGKKWS